MAGRWCIFLSVAAKVVVAKVAAMSDDASCAGEMWCSHSPASALMQASMQAATVTLEQKIAQQQDPDVTDDVQGGNQEDPFEGRGSPHSSLPSKGVPIIVNGTGKTHRHVKLALYLNNIDDVMSRQNVFIGEVIVACQYRLEDFPEGTTIEIENGKVDWRNEVRREDDGSGNITGTEHLYVRIHFDGRYDQFPFDRQNIQVSFHMQGLTSKEASFVAWPEYSGLRPVDPDSGKHFKTTQYYVADWKFLVRDHQEYGMPYAKSTAQLSLVIGRALPYYALTCSLIPTMAIFFAILAFCLPITLIVPRVTVSFTSFLAMFVHVKQMTNMVPDGVWCWLMTDLTFFCTILAAAITSNMVSAKLFHGKEARLSEVHDGFVRWVLPAEFVTGQIVITVFRYWHKQVGFTICGMVLLFHVWVPCKFYQAANLSDDHNDLFFNGLFLVVPCLFGNMHGDAVEPTDEVTFCPWLFAVNTHQSSEALAGPVVRDKHQNSSADRIRGGGEEQATAAAQSGNNAGDNDDGAHGDDAGDTGGDLDMADGGDAGM